MCIFIDDQSKTNIQRLGPRNLLLVYAVWSMAVRGCFRPIDNDVEKIGQNQGSGIRGLGLSKVE